MNSAKLALPLEEIASCFEGILPSTVCSCSADGLPNLTFLSVVQRLDENHVALSFQFFNKTRKNVQENPRVQVVVVSPQTAEQYRLDLQYLRTEGEGAAFDRMKARLDGVASQTGMSHVFKLQGVDIYEVLDCRPVNSGGHAERAANVDRLGQLDAFTTRLSACGDLDSLIQTALESLSALLGYEHSFVMVPDEQGKVLYTIASHGFNPSGVGSEVRMGEGLLGVAAERRSVVRNTNLARDLLFMRAVRSVVERRGEQSALEKEIPLPGLPNVQSQLVLPLIAHDELHGLLCLQSQDFGRFLAADEQVMQIAARHLAAAMALLELPSAAEKEPAPEHRKSALHAAIDSVIKHYGSDDSIFIDDSYLIKGIAGRILWKLLRAYVESGRVQFSNREVRLDSTLQLPDIKDNLETRLILLRRRLDERCDFVRINRAGRGRFQLDVRHRLKLEEHP